MGAVRLLCALGVLLAHSGQIFSRISDASIDLRLTLGISGGYSVLWFYVISGFLMSMVLSTKYSADAKGTKAFYKARFLRIYPLWAVLFLIYGSFIPVNGGNWFPQHGILDWIQALVLFGQDWRSFLNDWSAFPPAGDVTWTLGAELTFYLMAPLLCRSMKFAIAVFALSAAVRIIVALVIPLGSPDRVFWSYFFFPSVLVFFLGGHFARLLHANIKVPVVLGYASLALSFWLSLSLAGPLPFDNLRMYAAIVPFALGLPTLFATTKNLRWSNFLGDLTYPLYLISSALLLSLFSVWPRPWPMNGYGDLILRTMNMASNPYAKGLILVSMILGFAIPAAVLTRYLLEKPAIYLFSRSLKIVGAMRAAVVGYIASGSPAASEQSVKIKMADEEVLQRNFDQAILPQLQVPLD